MYRPDHAKHTESTAHHDDRVQYLIVGDESSFAELESELALLPLCARGRVFVEVDRPDHVSVLVTPLRMTVTWLPRAARAGAPGSGEPCRPGQAALRAVKGWTAEMLCDGPGETHAILAGGYALVADVYDHLVNEMGMHPGVVSAPAAFRLRASN